MARPARASPSSPTGSRPCCWSSPRSLCSPCSIYAIGEPGAERNHVGFQSAYLVLAAGVAASFLTGDLFNLFVAFEMMLTASYVLLTLGGRREQVRAGMTYIVISLVASTLFVTALALLYSATGTVNMADLASASTSCHRASARAFAVLLLVVFGIKAAVFPLFFWLPDSYPTAPSPITAVFAGLLTKVGVYAIIRTQLLLFTDDAAARHPAPRGRRRDDGHRRARRHRPGRHPAHPVVHHREPDRLHGHGARASSPSPASPRSSTRWSTTSSSRPRLFLIGGLVDHAAGSSRLSRIGGMVRTTPFLAAMFLVSALSLAGIPPLSGFISKFALVRRRHRRAPLRRDRASASSSAC